MDPTTTMRLMCIIPGSGDAFIDIHGDRMASNLKKEIKKEFAFALHDYGTADLKLYHINAFGNNAEEHRKALNGEIQRIEETSSNSTLDSFTKLCDVFDNMPPPDKTIHILIVVPSGKPIGYCTCGDVTGMFSLPPLTSPLCHAHPPNNYNDSLIDHPLPPRLSLADRLSLPPIMVFQRLIPDAHLSTLRITCIVNTASLYPPTTLPWACYCPLLHPFQQWHSTGPPTTIVASLSAVVVPLFAKTYLNTWTHNQRCKLFICVCTNSIYTSC